MNKRYKNVKAIIFDVDGVIFDTEAVWCESFKMTNKKLGVFVSEEFRQTCAGIPIATNLNRLREAFPHINADEYMDCAKLCYDEIILKKGALLKPGFVEIIEYLKKKNLKLAICTGSTNEKLTFLFDQVGIDHTRIFDVIVTSEYVEKPKPDPMPYLMACEKLGERPSECLVIEDSINGINSAYDAGALPVMVLDIIKPDSKTKDKCERVFNTLMEIKEII